MLIIGTKIYTKSQNSVKIVYKSEYMGGFFGEVEYFSC